MTADTQPAEFIGRPVTGDINRPSLGHDIPQWGPDRFKELLDALFAAGAVAVRWEQYTPHFNDGDPCVFGVNEASVKFAPAGRRFEGFVEVDPDEDDDEDWHDDWQLKDYDPATRRSTAKPGKEQIAAALAAFNSATGHFEDALLAAFGDHCRVTATPQGFAVDEYSHD